MRWIFHGNEYETIDDFSKDFISFNDGCLEGDFPVIIDFNKVRIYYSGDAYEEQVSKSPPSDLSDPLKLKEYMLPVDIDSSTSGDLTFFDMMYQFHQATLQTLNSQEMTHVMFEGFTPGDTEEGRKVLFMRLGN